MTLIKKLSLGVLIMLFLIFVGTYLITMNNSRNFFIQQIENNAQDTATSLGLSLSQSLMDHDHATVEAMVQAVFDRGYFSSIEVKDIQGNMIVSKSVSQSSNAPLWFVNLMRLHATQKSSLIMQGWRQAGVVLVKGNPGYAYSSLWGNAIQMLKAYLIFAAISLLLVYGFIRFLLNPLKRIRAQALAISEHRFLIEHKIPKLPELRQVTLAMNQMSSMIKSLFQDQLHQINTLRGEVYQDPLTGLSNRRYFMQQLSSLLEHQDEFIPGFIVMIVIDGLSELNAREGFQQGDKLIITIAQVCREFWQSKVNIIARINGSTIAFISHETNHEAFVEDCNKFEQSLREVLGDSKCTIHIGATNYFLHQSSSNLLTIADSAVKKAREQGVFYCERNKEQFSYLPVISPKEINQALKEKTIHLMCQAVTDENKVLHKELFPRLHDSKGNEFGAGFFMPLAEQVKVAHLIDLYVLNEVASKKLSAKHPFALNLSEDTLTHIQHSEHYLQQLQKMSKADLKNISLEIKESLVLSHFVEVKDFILQAKKYGVKIGIDRVGIHFSPLYYLNDLPVNYLKLDGSLIKDVEENKSKQFFIYYFNKMAKTMNIQVIATQVENKTQWETLKMAHIPWGQGKYLAEVVELG